MTIPEERVKRALLKVEQREVIEDLAQINAAILHLLSGGKSNYDVAKNLSDDKKTDYNTTSDEILSALESRRQERENRLKLLSDDLALLGEEP